MSRLDATPVQKRRIRERFKFECAACGRSSELEADVAHPFEDASERKPTDDRLIVLCSGCNQAEDRAKGRHMPPLSELFNPEEVSVRARRSYREGRYSSAYAGHRLAAYLFEMQGSYSKAVACLVEATSALRPIRWGDFLTSTLLEVERLCSSHNVAPVQRWLCLDRFSLVLYDYRRWKESAEVQYASTLLRDKVDDDLRDPEQLKFDQASSFRRQALIEGSTGATGQKKLSSLLGKLIEDAREFELQSQLDGYATNLDVASKLALEIGKKPAEAHKYSEIALACEVKITHKWVLQEHYWREAEYYRSKPDPKAQEFVFKALRMFNDYPVVLEPTLGAPGPVQHNPISELPLFGIREDELRERGVAPSSNPPPELALRLSPRQLHRIVGRLVR